MSSFLLFDVKRSSMFVIVINFSISLIINHTFRYESAFDNYFILNLLVNILVKLGERPINWCELCLFLNVKEKKIDFVNVRRTFFYLYLNLTKFTKSMRPNSLNQFYFGDGVTCLNY